MALYTPCVASVGGAACELYTTGSHRIHQGFSDIVRAHHIGTTIIVDGLAVDSGVGPTITITSDAAEPYPTDSVFAVMMTTRAPFPGCQVNAVAGVNLTGVGFIGNGIQIFPDSLWAFRKVAVDSWEGHVINDPVPGWLT